MNCLLSNWKTPTEFRSTHLDGQINKRNGERMAVEMLGRQARPLCICLIKINSSWLQQKLEYPLGSRLQQVPFVFNEQTFLMSDGQETTSLVSLSEFKSSGGREGRGRNRESD